ncbi:MAG: phosphotransferase [Gammaproteobacteria bacterium]|nr:phosphotransferase [Gammaproteobacteria bacterium]MBU0877833.1 phosphotransferase [Alphaproteobacteria bacterium]
MSATPPNEPDLIPTHTTAATSSVVRWVERDYGLSLQLCHLIRRGLNDNYALRSADGARYVARLCSIRPRGAFNIDFEVSLLAHLHLQGAAVATPLLTLDGRTHVSLQFPEGQRALLLFRHVDGVVPDSLEDFELTGRTLAHVHGAALTYAGPPSRYTLNGYHLAGRTLKYLQVHPQLNDELLGAYTQLIHRLLQELAAAEGYLSRVVCHGDTHGFNNHMSIDDAGAPSAVFFDFDDAGPGYLAYDLCVLPWSYMFRKGLKEPDDTLRDRWAHYLSGYSAGGGACSKEDLAAIPLFMQLRHLWNLGEAVGRFHHWGTSSAPEEWLKKQVDVLEAWRLVDLGA